MARTISYNPYPWMTIENFHPSEAMVRAAAESFDDVKDWVKYGGDDAGQIQYCSKLGRQNVPAPALLLLDYIATHCNPDNEMGFDTKCFPDMSHYGGGMMITPNKNGEGGYLGAHVDASHHGIHNDWKREFSAILCLSEDYDSSFDLRVSDGKEQGTIPYKFNQLNVFKCSDNSWHGLPEITKGMDRKTLGVMFWSKDEEGKQIKAKFNNDLEWDNE
jgi:hypothetical protein